MKLAIVSDSHDHLKNLDKAVTMINKMNVSLLIHCGDPCSAFMIESLARFSGDVYLVFGNNEGDRVTITSVAERYSNINIRGEFGTLDIGSKSIAWTHRPEFGDGLASTGKFTAVFSGHTHIRKSEKIGDTWHINPGELMGLREDPGFAVFDPETGELEYFDL